MRLWQKFKTISYCVGGKHYSGTNIIKGFISAKGIKILMVNCTTCRRMKSISVSDATIEAE